MSRLEQLRRLDRLYAERGRAAVPAPATYSVGDHVWCFWGRARKNATQIGRVVSPRPLDQHGHTWWLVDVYVDDRKRWIPARWRRVQRPLSPGEVHHHRGLGVIQQSRRLQLAIPMPRNYR
jgi:hypothetical protein